MCSQGETPLTMDWIRWLLKAHGLRDHKLPEECLTDIFSHGKTLQSSVLLASLKLDVSIAPQLWDNKH